jgi:non-homologous end joining protein Ku
VRNAKRRKPEPKVIDLMEALQASVAEAKAGAKKGSRTSKAASGKRRQRRSAA